jgi:hypothetical protein
MIREKINELTVIVDPIADAGCLAGAVNAAVNMVSSVLF